MDLIPIQDRTKTAELSFTTNSVVLDQRNFRREFPGRHCPCERTIKRLVDKFRNTGSLVDNNKGHSGRPFSARTPANNQAVRDCLQQSPRKINKAAVTRIRYLKDICTKSHTQTDANKRERLEFSQSISERIENNPGVLDLIFFSDEAHFYFRGHVNKQNIRFWAPNQPHQHIQSPLS